MYLYLVRHGQSEGNARRLFFGHTDYPLTALGREQARQAADKLRAVSFSRCVASDLLRAWETAEICVGSRALRPENAPPCASSLWARWRGATGRSRANCTAT